ncbi:MAG: TIGR03557 family F420-dependent LLM class oxidoreductase [Thaumarchaeota archaeon]|nr:TIGR03557 family F420-dependent LLM class oxidoreductase [Nitrososphaerota archaeon]
MKFGFHPLTDFFSPKKVLEETVAAERHGFTEIFYADHFHPWSSSPGTSFAWTVIASAAERTQKARIGTAVTCPMLRYNPAIVAQAFASLASTYEGRIFLGVGTGEALNEVPVGYNWPKGKTRLEMFEESIKVIRMLWNQEFVTFKGEHYQLKEANLFTKPLQRIPLYVSALGPKAARIAGRLGEGLITLNLPEERIRQTVLPAFEEGIQIRGREHGLGLDSSSKPIKIAEIIVSYAEDYEEAVESLRPFAGTLTPGVFKNELIDPREIKAAGEKIDKKIIGEAMLATTDVERIVPVIEKFDRLSFDLVEIVSLSPDQEGFLRLFEEKIMPSF